MNFPGIGLSFNYLAFTDWARKMALELLAVYHYVFTANNGSKFSGGVLRQNF